ncbi:MAG: ATP-binding cassette domain-containing protein, partial [Clostridia bacterium]|nr:ATP-binding cassette domain-containing protein [Clostridia bacterium]
NAIKLDTIKGDIEFKAVNFKYNDNSGYVLKDFDFKVNSGEIVALVGPSGSGKTTVANLIPRFYEITEGSLTIDGYDVKDIELKSLRQNIGMVFQDVYLFWGTVAENIAYGKPNATRDEIIESAKKAGAHEFIMQLPDGYDSMVGERGVKLSGGQKQRICIARVFLKNPPFIILDEATSSLDNESELLVQRSLDELVKDRTAIIIAHRLSTIRNATKIVVLTNDGIVETGTHDELVAINGTYKCLYDLSVSVQTLQQYDN